MRFPLTAEHRGADHVLWRRARWLLAALAVSLGPAAVSAQNQSLWFTQLSRPDGLSDHQVYSIAQDSKGFLWIGTAAGLNRYDGYGFKVYKHDPDDPRSLSDDQARVVHVDRAGVLWIGTERGGLNRFDSMTETFTHYRHDPSDARSLGADDVRAIHEDRSGGLWIGTQHGGLSRLDRASGVFTHYRHDPADPDSLGSDDVRAILEDRAGQLWIGTNSSGLDRLDRLPGRPTSGRFVHYRPDPADPGSISHDDVRALCEDRQGALWIGTNRTGLDRLDRATGVFTNYRRAPRDPRSLSHNDVRAIFEDRRGNLWIATHGGGLNRWDRATGRFEHHRSNPRDAGSLGNDDVRALYEDRSGVLWIATHGAGLNRLDREASYSRYYTHDPTDAQSLSDNMIHVIYEDRRGAVWLGTEYGGLNRMDRATGTFTHYRHDPNDRRSLSHDDVRAILEDRAGVLWIGTQGGGLNRFDRAATDGAASGRATDSFTRYRHGGGSETLAHDDVRALYEDREGTLWIGFKDGRLDVMDRSEETFRRADVAADPERGDRGGVKALFEDSSGSLWIAFDKGGLLRLDRDTGESVAYRHDADDPGSLSSDEVRAAHLDGAGTLWVGTRAGLSRFDRATETFTHFTEEAGLPRAVIRSILEDERGSLWLVTSAGMSRFDPGTGSFRSYSGTSLGKLKPLSPNTAFRTGDGEILIGGRSGMVAFFPADIELGDDPPEPSLVFTSFKVAGQDVGLETSITETSEIALTHRDRFLSFEVAMLGEAPQKYRYAYRLEGLHDAWLDLEERRELSFSSLAPGSYTLRVRGWSVDRSVPEKEIGLAIRVAPPFWATWWFRTLAAVTGLTLLSLVYQMRTRSIRLHNARLQAEISERERVQAEREILIQRLENQNAERETLIQQLESQNAELERFTYTVSHDLKSPLVTIQGFLGLLRKDAHAGDVERIEHYMARISAAVKTMRDLLDDLLELSRIGRVVHPPQEVALSELAAEAVELVAGQIVERDVEVTIDSEMPAVRIDRARMLEVFQNLVDNAVKFMGDQPAPRVEIGAMRDRNEVHCHVRDNGKGIEPRYLDRVFGLFDRLDPTVDGTGIGLALVKRIVELHEGRVWVESEGLGHGSTFRFTLPLRPAEPERAQTTTQRGEGGSHGSRRDQG